MKILTCSVSLLEPGVCCEDSCTEPATLAALYESDAGFVEHTRCAAHLGNPAASKPLVLSPLWDGTGT